MSEQEPELDYCFVVSTASGDGEVRVRTTGEVLFTYGNPSFVSANLAFPTEYRPHPKMQFVDRNGTQFVENKERLLCHYTRTTTALDFILKDQRLLLSSFERTNDPRENKDFDFCVVAEAGRAPGGAAITVSRELSRELRQHARLVCFCADGHHYKEPSVAPQDGTGWQHPRMWAQYGENYSGVVLVFDQRQLLLNAQAALAEHGELVAGHVLYLQGGRAPTFWPWLVEYEQWEKLGASAFSAQHLAEYADWLFFSKHADWSQEQEFRIVLLAKEPVQAFVPITNALREICVGHRMSQQNLAEIYAAGQRLGVPVSMVSWRNGNAIRDPYLGPPALPTVT